MKKIVKVGLSPCRKNCFIYFYENLLTMMKTFFYFFLKALFVLKIFKCLPWLFCRIRKTAWLKIHHFFKIEGTSLKYIKKELIIHWCQSLRLKRLVSCQVFLIKVRCLQDQYISVWASVFYYWIFNNLLRQKIVI